jgi:DNA polymerase III alpha subunit
MDTSGAVVGLAVAALIIQDRYDEAVETAQRLLGIYGDRFFIELQPHLLRPCG